jgi:hypothetical protein
MRRTKLVLAAAALMVAMLVAFSAPAMANNTNDDNVQRHSSNIFDDNHHNDIFDDGDNCCRDHDGDFDFANFDNDFDDDDFDFDNNDFFFTPFFFFAIEDIDCDGVDDDFDGGIDEDALVCVVEFD